MAATMFECLSSKLPPLPLPSKLGGQLRALKGGGKNKSTWQCDFRKHPLPPPFSFVNADLMGRNKKNGFFLGLYVA